MRARRKQLAWLVLLATILSFASVGCRSGAGGERLFLTRDGAATSLIVQPDQPDPWEQMAADELVSFLEKISGAHVPVATLSDFDNMDLPAGTIPILIGRAARERAPDLEVERALDARNDFLSCRDGFVLRVRDNVIAFSGLPQLEDRPYQSKGTLYGAYELLGRVGCRWFWPGELGQVLPKRTNIALAPFETVAVPSFDFRVPNFTGGTGRKNDEVAAWNHRNRISGVPWALSHNNTLIGLTPDPSAPEAKGGQ